MKKFIHYSIQDIDPKTKKDVEIYKKLEFSKFWTQMGFGSKLNFKSINFVPGSQEYKEFLEDCKANGIEF